MTGPPALSVIVAATTPLRALPESVTAVQEQGEDQQVETILAYGSDDEVPPVPSDLPGLSIVRLPGDATLPRLLGVALSRASGDVIAITDATCRVHPRWVSSILRAHKAPHVVVGGAVEPDGLRTLVDWTAYFCDYGQFMLPLAEGAAREMPGNNISLKRSALSEATEFVEREFWKTYWCQALQAAGHVLRASPSPVVFYRKRFRLLPYLAHRFHNGRCFAGMRTTQMGGGKRLFYVIVSPLLPVVFCWRILANVAPKGRHRSRLAACFPLIVLATASWSLGELLGYLSGPGSSCRHVR